MPTSSATATATALRQRNWSRNVADVGARIAIYDESFAANPHQIYDLMREQYGTVVPVSIAEDMDATLVVGYNAARTVLGAPEHFPADPSIWQRSVRADHPLLPMLEWRPNALRSTGVEHARFRTAINAALRDFDVAALRTKIRDAAAAQIATFSGRGSAELIGDYAQPLVAAILTDLLGCDADIGARIAGAIARMFEGTDTGDVNATLEVALYELVMSKRGGFGRDLTSRMLAHGELDVAEICHQLVTLYSAAIEPVVNLIINTILKVLSNPRYTSAVDRPGLGIGAAMEEILVEDPPLAAHGVSYPRQPTQIEGVWVPAHMPVIISFAAANRDPEVVRTGPGADLSGNGYSGIPGGSWHLAFGSGPHSCPAMGRTLGHHIALDAVLELFDWLPDMAPTTRKPQWRPGPFHRALTALEVRFPPTDHRGSPLKHTVTA